MKTILWLLLAATILIGDAIAQGDPNEYEYLIPKDQQMDFHLGEDYNLRWDSAGYLRLLHRISSRTEVQIPL